MADETTQHVEQAAEPPEAKGSMKEYVEWREQGAADAEIEAPTPEQRNESEMGRYIRERNEEKSPNKGFHKRISKLSSQKREYRERAEAAEARLAQYEQSPQQQAPQERQSGQYRAEDVEQQYSARSEETRRQAESQADHAAFGSYRDGVREILAGFSPSEVREFHRAADKIKIPNEVAGKIVSLENGPEVTLYLAQHPEEARHLANLKLPAAVREIDRISFRLEDAGKPRIESRAPAPIRPVGSSSTKSSASMDEMNMADFTKARQSGRTR
jgi:hypothetical protein